MKNSIDPTGTYELGNHQPNADIQGKFGKIQVLKIDKNKIAMTFMINRGSPSYNSGTFIDTLTLKKNSAIYTSSYSEEPCEIIFNFDSNGLDVIQQTKISSFSCGFGYGVVAKGYFRKTSNAIPVLEDPNFNMPL
jgi:hypothetical protein